MGGREARAETLISFRPAAARELIAAVAHYDRDRDGRGQRFADAVERALELLVALPQAAPILLAPDIRAAKVRYFPYRVIYVVVRDTIDVIAVAHAKRRPGYWQRQR
ncbi:MAG: type II toxin-antitoxin system RelE/ParE family toxin [Kofleriaceae bacterium]